MSFEHRYSDLMVHKKIALLGIYPPPLGGVSVHIKRVMRKLEMQHNTVLLFTTERWYRNWFFVWYMLQLTCWLFYHRPDVVIYHSSYVTTGLLEIVILSWLKKIVRFSLLIIEHDCRHIYQRSACMRAFYNRALSRIDGIVFIGDKTRKSYDDMHMQVKTWSQEGAFLPACLADKQRIINSYPSSLHAFIQARTPRIIANAAHCMRIKERDVYGIDQCIALVHQLKNEYPAIGMIIVLAQVGDEEYFAALCQRIKEYDIEEHIYVLLGNYELWPLFDYADLFVRPTLSDGASISIQEALYCRVPVVASSVCERPQSVITFDIEKSDTFTMSIKKVLKGNEKSL